MSQLVTYHIIHALTLQKCHLNFWERNGSGCIAKNLYYVFPFLRKAVCDTDNFIHASTYSYNKVMQLHKFASVAKV